MPHGMESSTAARFCSVRRLNVASMPGTSSGRQRTRSMAASRSSGSLAHAASSARANASLHTPWAIRRTSDGSNGTRCTRVSRSSSLLGSSCRPPPMATSFIAPTKMVRPRTRRWLRVAYGSSGLALSRPHKTPRTSAGARLSSSRRTSPSAAMARARGPGWKRKRIWPEA